MIRTQRTTIARRLRRTPSLAASLTDPDWWADAWGDAVAGAAGETGLETFPDDCPWQLTEILDLNWMPN